MTAFFVFSPNVCNSQQAGAQHNWETPAKWLTLPKLEIEFFVDGELANANINSQNRVEIQWIIKSVSERLGNKTQFSQSVAETLINEAEKFRLGCSRVESNLLKQVGNTRLRLPAMFYLRLSFAKDSSAYKSLERKLDARKVGHYSINNRHAFPLFDDVTQDKLQLLATVEHRSLLIATPAALIHRQKEFSQDLRNGFQRLKTDRTIGLVVDSDRFIPDSSFLTASLNRDGGLNVQIKSESGDQLYAQIEQLKNVVNNEPETFRKGLASNGIRSESVLNAITKLIQNLQLQKQAGSIEMSVPPSERAQIKAILQGFFLKEVKEVERSTE